MRLLRRTRLVSLAVVASSGLLACGDEDAGGGPAGGFDDQAPETDFSDDVDDRTTTSNTIDIGGDEVEGTDTEAGTPPGHVGNVEGEGDVNDLEPGDG